LEFEVRRSGSVAPLVAVMDSADARDGHDFGVSGWPFLNRPRLWAVLVEGQVAPVVVIVAKVVSDQATGVGLA
jgi:hypothetical protein